MTDQWDFDETAPITPDSGPKPLRDYAKAQKQRADDADARLAALEARLKQSEIKDLFEAQGVPRTAAKYYSGDATEEAISSFVTDMRSTFGGAAPVPSTPVVQTPAISPSDQQKLQTLMQAGADGNTAGNYDVAFSALNDPSLSTADRIAAWQNFARNSGTTQ